MDNLSLTFLLAWRYFRASKDGSSVSVVTWFSIAGIAVGVAAIVVALAIFTGFRIELRQRVHDIDGAVGIEKLDASAFYWDSEFTASIQGIAGIEYVVPYVTTGAIVTHGAQAHGAIFRGVALKDLEKIPLIEYVTDGSYSAGGFGAQGEDYAHALIGSNMSRSVGVSVGDTFTVFKGDDVGSYLSTGDLPDTITFKISGIFQTGIEEVDQFFVISSIDAVRSIRSTNGSKDVNGVQVYAENSSNIGNLVEQINEVGNGRFPGARSTLIYNRSGNSFQGFSPAMHLELAREQESALLVVLSLIIVVATFGVVASQVVKVQEKAREIAVLRSIGLGSGLILRIFLILGLLIGVAGASLGLVVGFAVASNLESIRLSLEAWFSVDLFPADHFRLTFLPSHPSLAAAITTSTLAIILTILAVSYPAIQASRVRPAEALRYE